jgi:hypothetical protein
MVLSRLPGLLLQQGSSRLLRPAVGVVGHAQNSKQAAATSSPTSSSRHFSSTPTPASEEAGSSSSSPAFGLTEEQEQIFTLAREFAKEKMLPHAAAWEEDKARQFS